MNHIDPTTDNGSILIVDDTPENLRLLTELLEGQGYTVRTIPNAGQALESLHKWPPDLILLDIMMPKMDGYEFCQRVKSDELTKDIPIIFIIARNEAFDKATAFSIGGVDYITKPIQGVEILARVRTHMMFQKARQTLEQKNALLEAQNRELDAFAHTVAHDLKNPLSIISSFTLVLSTEAQTLTPAELQTIGARVHQSSQKAISIIEDLLLLANVRKKEIVMTALDMAAIVEQAQARLEMMITDFQGQIIIPETWPIALGYGPWVEEVWANYLSNGLKYGGKPPRLELGANLEAEGKIRFWVRDNGSGITPEAQAKLFVEFTRLKRVSAGYGPGLSIVRRIVEKLGGEVGVESNPMAEKGSTFYFTLPAAEEDSRSNA